MSKTYKLWEPTFRGALKFGKAAYRAYKGGRKVYEALRSTGGAGSKRPAPRSGDGGAGRTSRKRFKKRHTARGGPSRPAPSESKMTYISHEHGGPKAHKVVKKRKHHKKAKGISVKGMNTLKQLVEPVRRIHVAMNSQGFVTTHAQNVANAGFCNASNLGFPLMLSDNEFNEGKLVYKCQTYFNSTVILGLKNLVQAAPLQNIVVNGESQLLSAANTLAYPGANCELPGVNANYVSDRTLFANTFVELLPTKVVHHFKNNRLYGQEIKVWFIRCKQSTNVDPLTLLAFDLSARCYSAADATPPYFDAFGTPNAPNSAGCVSFDKYENAAALVDSNGGFVGPKPGDLRFHHFYEVYDIEQHRIEPGDEIVVRQRVPGFKYYDVDSNLCVSYPYAESGTTASVEIIPKFGYFIMVAARADCVFPTHNIVGGPNSDGNPSSVVNRAIPQIDHTWRLTYNVRSSTRQKTNIDISFGGYETHRGLPAAAMDVGYIPQNTTVASVTEVGTEFINNYNGL